MSTHFYFLALTLSVCLWSPTAALATDEKAIHAVSTYDDCYNIACSACGVGYDEQALATLRSVLMFHHDAKRLCFHIFAEPQLHESLHHGMAELKRNFGTFEWEYRLKNIQYPKAFGSTDGWKKMFKPCSTQRLFIPLVLEDVPHLIYTDIDVLFIGPVSAMYDHLDRFTPDQVMGMVPEHEPNSGLHWYREGNARHPFYKPLGLNAGLLLINAKRLREHRDFGYDFTHPDIKGKISGRSGMVEGLQFSDLLKPIQQQYGWKLTWGDQCLLNVLWSLHPEKLYELPCSVNYRSDHCAYGENCKRVPKIIHGSRSAFLRRDDKLNTFGLLYQSVAQAKNAGQVLSLLQYKVQQYQVRKRNRMVKMYNDRSMHDYCLDNIELIYKALRLYGQSPVEEGLAGQHRDEL